MHAARTLLEKQPGRRTHRFLRDTLDATAASGTGLKQLKVALLSSFSIEFVQDSLVALGLLGGMVRQQRPIITHLAKHLQRLDEIDRPFVGESLGDEAGGEPPGAEGRTIDDIAQKPRIRRDSEDRKFAQRPRQARRLSGHVWPARPRSDGCPAPRSRDSCEERCARRRPIAHAREQADLQRPD